MDEGEAALSRPFGGRSVSMVQRQGSRTFALACLTALALALLIYWPVHGAGFAWDDFKFLLESGWMTDSSRWPDLIKHGFPEWAGYYRPLGVVLYIVETNLAGFSPAPMHLLSLGIHLANIILVGMLARSLMRECSEPAASGRLQTIAWPFAAMCLYALHPALVEPVVWISAQYDMLTTGFMLLGLVLNLRLRNIVLRAAGVAFCFFLAACAKEAALSFPFLLAIFDWLCARRAPVNHLPEREASSSALRAIAARQWPVYAAVLVAGIAYLCLRAWGLGFLINPATKATWSFWPQFQTTCFTYLAYWKLIVWPMSSLAPTYEVAVAPFATVSLKLLLVDAGAIAIAALGLWQLWRRTALGAAIAGASAALLPVLHIIPQEFAGSLYHCRYAMTAIATTCALVPLLLHGAKLHERSALLARSAAFCGCVWLAFATINTRICIPLWSDDVKLWQWALLENPGSSKVQESLLGAYIRTNDYDRAKVLADSMMQGEARSSFGSMSPPAFKVVNLLLHLANGALLYALLRRIIHRLVPPTTTIPPDVLALVIAGLWLLHPLHVSSVLYITQRMNVLATTFMLAGLVCYAEGRLLSLRGDRSGIWTGIFGMGLLGLLAVFSKETGAMIIVYALIIEWFCFRFETPSRQRWLLQALYLLGVALPLALYAVNLLLHPELLNWTRHDFTVYTRLLSEARVVCDYLLWTFVPLPSSMSIFHDDIAASTGLFAPPTTAVSILFLLGLALAAWHWRKRAPAFAFGVACGRPRDRQQRPGARARHQ